MHIVKVTPVGKTRISKYLLFASESVVSNNNKMTVFRDFLGAGVNFLQDK